MTTSTRKVLPVAVALCAAVGLTAVPASATTPPTTLAAAETALTTAQAQVQVAIKDQATLSVTAWDAQMEAALVAEAAAEANLRPFLVPPSATDFGVVHTFTYKTGELYTVKLISAQEHTTGTHVTVVFVNINNPFVPANADLPPSANAISADFITQLTVVGSNGQTYHASPCTTCSTTNGVALPTTQEIGLDGWSIGRPNTFKLPTGVTVAQVMWSNPDPNGETTTAVWNV